MLPDPIDPVELAVLKDRDFMPIKQRVARKLEAQLTRLGHGLLATAQQADSALPEVVFEAQPKLARGENYHSYAYRLVDFPRVFAGEDMLAFRSIVLWGHAVGYHLMLAGRYRARYLAPLAEAIPELPAGYFLCAQDTPWRWEHDQDGLVPAQGLTAATSAELLQARAFAKVSYFLPLDQIDQLEATGLAVWQRWQALLRTG